MAKDTEPKESGKTQKTPPVAQPSSSVILISPSNQILLLHRVKQSSSFPSAHVFPGGNLSAFHDGAIPKIDAPERHHDGEAYRLAAIRETFEESGILLARNNGFGRLLEVEDEEREKGRKEVHSNNVEFGKWLAGKGGRADVDGLIPFTRWITPIGPPKRFTTQMYIYFLPLANPPPTSTPDSENSANSSSTAALPSVYQEVVIPTPTHDGGLEHTAARFLYASEWLRMAQAGDIILFPPQFMLLHLIAPFLTEPIPKSDSTQAPQAFTKDELQAQRKSLQAFVRESKPPWGEKCISPIQILRRKEDGRAVLGLDKPGLELRNSDRRGESERVVLVDFKKEGPRNVEIRWRKEVLEEERGRAEHL